MGLDDRVMWFLLGCAVGFIVSQIIGLLRATKEELTEVHEIVKEDHSERKKDEQGAMDPRKVRGLALAFVVLLTAFAAFRAEAAADKSEDNRRQLARVVGCIVISNTELLNAINTRTTFTQGQAVANKVLQKAQKEFFGALLSDPPLPEEVRRKAAYTYDAALAKFVIEAEKAETSAKITTYPESADLLNCIREEQEG